MGLFDIGAYLRCTREAAGLTHPQVCDLPDGTQICTIENLSHIENGKRRPGPRTLALLLKKLGKEEVFGECYLQTSEYEVLMLDKELGIMYAEFRYSEAEKILEQIEARLSVKYLTNRQYLATNHAMLDLKLKRITYEEAIPIYTEIMRMTQPQFGTKSFSKAFISQREAIIILQIANAYGNIKNYQKALELLEETYKNLMRCPNKFHYTDGLFAVYMRAVIKWKGEQGKLEEAIELAEQEIAKAFKTGYADTLAGLLYAKTYNSNLILEKEKLSEKERSEINSGYEIAAIISEMFRENNAANSMRKKIQ